MAGGSSGFTFLGVLLLAAILLQTVAVTVTVLYFTNVLNTVRTREEGGVVYRHLLLKYMRLLHVAWSLHFWDYSIGSVALGKFNQAQLKYYKENKNYLNPGHIRTL